MLHAKFSQGNWDFLLQHFSIPLHKKYKTQAQYSIATTKRQTRKTKFNHQHSACFPAWAPRPIMNSFICDLFYDKHAQCSERNGALVCRVVNALLSDWKEAKAWWDSHFFFAWTSNGSLGMLGELMLWANPGKITKKVKRNKNGFSAMRFQGWK